MGLFKNVLIIAPNPQLPGGVSNYYNLFTKHKGDIGHNIQFLYVGTSLEKPITTKIYRTCIDILHFIRIVKHFDVVQINPSLGFFRGLVRDAFYNIVAKHIFNKKTIVFFRGWNKEAEKKITGIKRKVFNWSFKCDFSLVLASEFLLKLKEWKFAAKNVLIETTTFEKPSVNPIIKTHVEKVLFLARFSPDKGGELAIKTFFLLTKTHPNLLLYMAGDGPEKKNWETLAASLGVDNKVIFTGYVKGDKKSSLLAACDLLFFPTAYGEGMPNAIIEALGYGLIIIATPVGGIPDIVKNDINGWTLNSNSPEDFKLVFDKVLENSTLTKNISEENIEYALRKFEILEVIKRFKNYYNII